MVEPPGGLMRRLLPAAVAVAEGPFPDPSEPLCPEELVAVARAVPERMQEFAAGRAFARKALTSLGATSGPLPVGRNRAPVWPPGFVGSITHVGRYAAAAVAHSTDVAALGVDIEDSSRFKPALVEKVFSPSELRAYFPRDGPTEIRRIGCLIFSAKEAVYKALSALGEVRLTFADCTIVLDDAAGAFAAHLPSERGAPGAGGPIVGRFAWAGTFVGTAVILPANGPAVRG